MRIKFVAIIFLFLFNIKQSNIWLFSTAPNKVIDLPTIAIKVSFTYSYYQNKGVKSDNFFYRKVRKAITIWGQKTIDNFTEN